ncbi:hypothetical protein Tco_1327151 [Tanacetum coccineum]
MATTRIAKDVSPHEFVTRLCRSSQTIWQGVVLMFLRYETMFVVILETMKVLSHHSNLMKKVYAKGNQGEPLNAWWSSHLNDLMEKETICSEVIVIKRKRSGFSSGVLKGSGKPPSQWKMGSHNRESIWEQVSLPWNLQGVNTVTNSDLSTYIRWLKPCPHTPAAYEEPQIQRVLPVMTFFFSTSLIFESMSTWETDLTIFAGFHLGTSHSDERFCNDACDGQHRFTISLERVLGFAKSWLIKYTSSGVLLKYKDIFEILSTSSNPISFGEDRQSRDDEAMALDEAFCKDLEYGLPTTQAIEEGNSRTYVAEVLWNRFNGTTSFVKFSLTNHKPFEARILDAPVDLNAISSSESSELK